MSKVKFISSPTEIPAGQTFILVKYGEESGQTRNSLGLTITVPRNQSKTISDLSFLANIHTAKEIAKRESISNVFCLEIACNCDLFGWSAPGRPPQSRFSQTGGSSWAAAWCRLLAQADIHSERDFRRLLLKVIYFDQTFEG